MLGVGSAMIHAAFGWHICFAEGQVTFHVILVLVKQMKVGSQL